MLTKAQCKLFLCRALRLTPSDSLIFFQNGVGCTRTRRRVSEQRQTRGPAPTPLTKSRFNTSALAPISGHHGFDAQPAAGAESAGAVH
ncbi:hypothetical protein D9M68_546570 [compost metagenome]